MKKRYIFAVLIGLSLSFFIIKSDIEQNQNNNSETQFKELLIKRSRTELLNKLNSSNFLNERNLAPVERNPVFYGYDYVEKYNILNSLPSIDFDIINMDQPFYEKVSDDTFKVYDFFQITNGLNSKKMIFEYRCYFRDEIDRFKCFKIELRNPEA